MPSAQHAGVQPPGAPGAVAATERTAIAEQDRWRPEDIYADDAAWEADFALAQGHLADAARFAGRLGEGASALLGALQAQDASGERLERLYCYAQARGDEDTRIGAYQAMQDRVRALWVRTQSAWAFFDPEVLAIPEEAIAAWLRDPPPDASGLSVYRHRLDDLLRQKPHVLTVSEEGLLARMGEVGQTADNVFTMLNDADLTFPRVHDEQGREVELTKARYGRLIESHERSVRREAFQTLYATYGKQRNTLASLLASSVKRDWFYAEVRRHPSSVAAALDADNIPLEVYDNLIAAVRSHLPDLHRYLRLRRRMLGLERLQMYDLYVPLLRQPERHIPYAEAAETVERGLRPLGADYVGRYQRALKARWVDVYENQGKASGAYSMGVYGVHPYVLLNYQGTIDHVFTIAHEFGHAIHSQLAQESQPYPYAGHSIFVAEVASTVNEALLMHQLLSEASDARDRAYLVGHYLEEFRGTVFRQVMFAEFEKAIHAAVESGGALTADSLGETYRGLNLDYYGPEVDVDREIDLEWARIPHFYRAFYVYKYATGFSAAQALAQAVRDEGAPAVERYLGFLRAGASKYPVDLLRDAGVDMRTPAPVDAGLQVFARLVRELEELEASVR